MPRVTLQLALPPWRLAEDRAWRSVPCVTRALPRASGHLALDSPGGSAPAGSPCAALTPVDREGTALRDPPTPSSASRRPHPPLRQQRPSCHPGGRPSTSSARILRHSDELSPLESRQGRGLVHACARESADPTLALALERHLRTSGETCGVSSTLDGTRLLHGPSRAVGLERMPQTSPSRPRRCAASPRRSHALPTSTVHELRSPAAKRRSSARRPQWARSHVRDAAFARSAH